MSFTITEQPIGIGGNYNIIVVQGAVTTIFRRDNIFRQIIEQIYTLSDQISGGSSVFGSQAITNGLNVVSVIFAIPFAAVPVVVACVGIVTGEDEVYAVVEQDTVTVNGFTAKLSASVSSANYKLNWTAK